MCADNEAYQCVFQDEDTAGKRGVRLGKELMTVAGRAMQKNITRLGPLILPYSEQVSIRSQGAQIEIQACEQSESSKRQATRAASSLSFFLRCSSGSLLCVQIKFGLNLVVRKLDVKFRLVDKLVAAGIMAPAAPLTEDELKKIAEKEQAAAAKRAAAAAAAGKPLSESTPTRTPYRSRIPEYTPDFKKAVDHICIHAGGRAVIDAIQAGLKLSDDDVAASRAILKRYGNTSSSSIWYEFRHVVRKQKQTHTTHTLIPTGAREHTADQGWPAPRIERERVRLMITHVGGGVALCARVSAFLLLLLLGCAGATPISEAR